MGRHNYDGSSLDESGGEVILARATKNPYLVVGFTGFLVTLGIGAYKYRTRPATMSRGLFLVQLRVAAQSAVVGCLTIGMAVGMFQEYVLKKKPET